MSSFEKNPDPHIAWCEDHLEELAKYRNEHIAISPEKGIVIHESDSEIFEWRLRKLSKEERYDLYLTHTFLFVDFFV